MGLGTLAELESIDFIDFLNLVEFALINLEINNSSVEN